MNQRVKQNKVVTMLIAIFLLVSISEINSYAEDKCYKELENIEPENNEETIDEKEISEIINISDVNLKRAINKELDKSDINSSVTKSEIESLKSISSDNGSNKNIKSLSGLEYATNLESIDLSNNNIESINEIKNLFTNGKLKSVNISNQIIDLGTESIIENKYRIYNSIDNLDNKQIVPNYISDNGKYVEGNVLWDDLESFKDYNLYYNFEENVNKDGKHLVFGGRAYKYLQVGGDVSSINNDKQENNQESNKGENLDSSNDKDVDNDNRTDNNIDKDINVNEANIDKKNNSNNEVTNTDDGKIEDSKEKSQKQEVKKEENKEESSLLTPEVMTTIAIFGIGIGIKFMNMK